MTDSLNLGNTIKSYTKGKNLKQKISAGDYLLPYLTPDYLRYGTQTDFFKTEQSSITVEDNKTIVLWDGSNAGEIFLSKKGILSSTMVLVEPKDKVSDKYLYYSLKLLEYDLKSKTAGSGIPHVDKSILADYEILNLDQKYQHKVVEILDLLNKHIKVTQDLIAKQERIKRGLMQDLLTKGIDENGNIRSEKTHKFKDSPLGRIPEEWVFTDVGGLIQEKVLDSVQDGNHGEMHPKVSDFTEEGIPFIMASDISEGYIDFENCKRISEKQYNSLRIGFSKAGDILLSHKASIGFAAIVPKYVSEIMLTPQVTYYRVKNNEVIYNDYLRLFFQTSKFQSTLENLAKQSTRNYIGILAQRNLPVTFPSNLDEQYKISKVLLMAEKNLQNYKGKKAKYLNIKKGLMQDLLTGKVRVTNLLN